MKRKRENLLLCDSLMHSHETETKAAAREANVTIICNYIVKINTRLLSPKWHGLPLKISSFSCFKGNTLADRHTAIIIWLCQSLPNLSRATDH
jgi:hypothetical protein